MARKALILKTRTISWPERCFAVKVCLRFKHIFTAKTGVNLGRRLFSSMESRCWSQLSSIYVCRWERQCFCSGVRDTRVVNKWKLWGKRVRKQTTLTNSSHTICIGHELHTPCLPLFVKFFFSSLSVFCNTVLTFLTKYILGVSRDIKLKCILLFLSWF